MSVVDPAMFRLAAFDRFWNEQIERVRRGAFFGHDEMTRRLGLEKTSWRSRGREVGYFPSSLSSHGSDGREYGEPGAAWAFDHALTRALDALTVQQLEAVSLLLYANQPSWSATIAELEALVRPGRTWTAADIDGAGWLLQEWPWEDVEEVTEDPWPADWRLSGLPSLAARRGTAERLTEADRLRRRAWTLAVAVQDEAPETSQSVREWLRARFDGALAVFSGQIRVQPVMSGSTDPDVPMTVGFDTPAGMTVPIEGRGFRHGAQVTVWLTSYPASRRMVLVLSVDDTFESHELEPTGARGSILQFDVGWRHVKNPTRLHVAVFA